MVTVRATSLSLYSLYYWLIGCYDRQGVIICSICSKNSGLGHLWLTGNNDNAHSWEPPIEFLSWLGWLADWLTGWDGWPLPSAPLVAIAMYSKWRWSMVERSSHYNEVSLTSPLCYANGGAKSPLSTTLHFAAVLLHSVQWLSGGLFLDTTFRSFKKCLWNGLLPIRNCGTYRAPLIWCVQY